ncbi:MAG TPA: peptidylprolyl isomerase [Rhodocyclaceae bacterium]|nr:peptidylprolyl isomerase [Rhodocyclaceae bacterium]
MKSALLRTTLFAVAAALTAPAFADDTISVNGKVIPKARIEALVAGQVQQGQPDTPELRNAVKEELIRREVLVQAAQKAGVDKQGDVQTQIEMARQQVIIGAYLQNFVKNNPPTDAQVRQEYEAIKARLGDKEYHARHILVQTEDEAKAIIARLNKGDKFADLAKQSLDPGSKDRGGDLGWASPASYVQPFADALVALKPGAYTKDPVKTDFGYHVIELDEVRDLKIPTLEEATPQIKQRLAQQIVEKQVNELRSKAKVSQ